MDEKNLGFWDLVKAFSDIREELKEGRIKESYNLFIKYLEFCYGQNPENKEEIYQLMKKYQNEYDLYIELVKQNSDEFEKNSSVSSKNYFRFYKSCIFNNLFFNAEAAALWNSFLESISKEEIQKSDVIIKNFCKRCGNTVDLGKIDYKEYLRVVHSPQHICHQCEQWLKILNDFKVEYDWNPDWNLVIKDLEQLSLLPGQQADPSKLLPILQRHGIIMSKEIIGFWNSLFNKYQGDGIIKCYAVAGDFQGVAEQNFKRLLGGIFGSDNIR